MMSEHQFATGYSSFWREMTPMADAFMRAQNLMLDRFCGPLESTLDPRSRSFINELGFRLFARYAPSHKEIESIKPADVSKELIQEVINYVRRFSAVPNDSAGNISTHELHEAITLASRLFAHFKAILGEVIFLPRFHGCGLMGECEGDLFVRSILYEVKAGDRSFRVTDLRQLLIYCALNRGKSAYPIERVALINPRVGVYWAARLDLVARQVSGTTASQLLDGIVEFLAAPALYA